MDPLNLDYAVVIIKRFFHDNWAKIMGNLRKQTEEDFTFKSFHVEKAFIFFKDSNPTKLLCQNRSWTTVGKYYVKFERWSQDIHANQKLIPSYRGWA